MSPCFLLLDNIEVLFSMTPNSSQSDRSAEDTRGDGGGGVGGLGGRRRRRGAHRTSHAAIDRILSTLLVEIDGVKSPSSRSNANRVIVIATTCLHPREFDRFEIENCCKSTFCNLICDVVVP
jgi:SpoVK/Ycf46/Vps4 family AAA+-type ATPase